LKRAKIRKQKNTNLLICLRKRPFGGTKIKKYKKKKSKLINPKKKANGEG